MSLIQMSLSAALMIVAIIILRALTIERFPKKTFLVLWWIALLRLLIPFSIPSVMSIYSWISPDVPKAVHQEVQEITESQSTSEPVLEIPSEVLQNASPQEDAVSAVPEQTRSEVVENSTQFEMTPIPDTDIEYVEVKPSKSLSEIFFDMLPIIWGIGIGVIAAFFGINYWKGVREFRMSLPVENEFVNEWLSSHQLRRNITIRQYDCIHTPLTYGIFRPVILLPKESLKQPPSTLNFILTHEWVHIRRFDCVTKILLTAALCIHWMNPLVWVMYLLFNRDIELSCDETVLHLLGRNKRSDYALALIDMEEQKSGFASFASGFGRNAIEERIRAIMKMKKASIITILAAVVVVACVSILFATSAKNNPTESPSASEESSSDTVVQNIYDPNLYKDYEPYGLKFDLENSKLYFEGKLVRCFDDQWKGDNLNTKGIGYYETHGTVDIKAVHDSNDQLTGLQKATEEEFAAREIPEPTAAEVATVDDPRKVASDYPLHSMIQQKDTDVWTYLKKPIRTLMDRATGMVYFSENGEINLNVVRNEYGEAQSLETLCDEEVRQELSEYAPEYLFSEDKLKIKEVLNYGEPASWLREEYLSNRHLSFDENGNFLYDDQLVRYFIDGSNSYFSDDFSGDLDEYLKKIRGYSYEYYNPNGVIDIYSVRKQDTLLDIKAFEPEQTAGWAFKTIQRKPLAGGFGNEELQIIANEFAPYNITLGPDNRLYFNGELIRCWADTAQGDTTGAEDIFYINNCGVVDIRTVYSSWEREDGMVLPIGKFDRIELFDAQNLIEEAVELRKLPSQSNWATSDIVKQRQQKYARLEQLFDPLASFGVSYKASDIMTGIGSVYYNGEPVQFFIDPHGGTNYCFASNLSEGKFSLKTTRDKGNHIIGVEQISNEEAQKLFQQQQDSILIPNYQSPVISSTHQEAGYSGTSRIYYASSDCSVSAVSDGVVVSAGWNTSRGYSVQIVDENDMVWVYSHMDSLDVNAGDVVSTGDKIGVVGYTGWAEQIQLELELWYGGQPINLNNLV